MKIIKFILLFSLLGLFGFGLWSYTNGFESSEMPLPLVQEEDKTYQEVLASGVHPALAPEYDFPASYQYLNGCYGFAVGHILMDRGRAFDMLEMEEQIQKPREELWNKEYKNRLAEAYDLELKLSKNPELLFQLLSEGEAVVVGFLLPLEGDETVLHAVAAYSFDEEGLWVSDSLKGGPALVPYEEIFTEKGDETRYYFTRVLES